MIVLNSYPSSYSVSNFIEFRLNFSSVGQKALQSVIDIGEIKAINSSKDCEIQIGNVIYTLIGGQEILPNQYVNDFRQIGVIVCQPNTDLSLVVAKYVESRDLVSNFIFDVLPVEYKIFLADRPYTISEIVLGCDDHIDISLRKNGVEISKVQLTGSVKKFLVNQLLNYGDFLSLKTSKQCSNLLYTISIR